MENFVNIEFYRSTNKNIFSLIFHCAGTESKFYFQRNSEICFNQPHHFILYSSGRFNIKIFNSTLVYRAELQIKIINSLKYETDGESIKLQSSQLFCEIFNIKQPNLLTKLEFR